jgi:hypothetical protein
MDAQVEAVNIGNLEKEIVRKEADLVRFQKALDRVNDSYDIGDYEREEWLRRKRMWEGKIKEAQDSIYAIRKELASVPSITSAMRKQYMDEFFNKINRVVSNEEMNDLYKTIIESIIWLKDGKNISIEIRYR